MCVPDIYSEVPGNVVIVNYSLRLLVHVIYELICIINKLLVIITEPW